jgi:hypothetical protein
LEGKIEHEISTNRIVYKQIKEPTICEFLLPSSLLRDQCVAGPAVFVGAPEVGLGNTFPFMRITFVGAFTAFEVIVTLLLIAPDRLVLYFTSISAVVPGAIGSLGQEGTVHEQDPFTFERINGALPVFVNLNL